MPKPESGSRWMALAGWLAIILVIGYGGAAINTPKIPTWYAGIAKPAFTPPPLVFSIIWTVLYLAMAVAVWRIGNAAATRSECRLATGLFIGQLAINALWSPAFFGLQSPTLGLLVTVALVVVLVPTTLLFLRLDRVAGFLLIPYVGWAGFAVVLNAAIVALN